MTKTILTAYLTAADLNTATTSSFDGEHGLVFAAVTQDVIRTVEVSYHGELLLGTVRISDGLGRTDRMGMIEAVNTGLISEMQKFVYEQGGSESVVVGELGKVWASAWEDLLLNAQLHLDPWDAFPMLPQPPHQHNHQGNAAD